MVAKRFGAPAGLGLILRLAVSKEMVEGFLGELDNHPEVVMSLNRAACRSRAQNRKMADGCVVADGLGSKVQRRLWDGQRGYGQRFKLER